MSSMDLVNFLNARLDEDARGAQALNGESLDAYLEGGDDGWAVEGDTVEAIVGDRAFAEHIARHDPARVLADVAAKRLILEQWRHKSGSMSLYPNPGNAGGFMALDGTLRALALPYADHPDYREEWKP